MKPNTLDSMFDLVTAVISKAINDGAITDRGFTWLLGASSREELADLPRDINVFREEARQFIRDWLSDKPYWMAKVEEYWENPVCRQCGCRVDWPREYCYNCLSPEERKNPKKLWTIERRRRRHNAKLQRRCAGVS